MPEITTLFWDVGGVLLTNGWEESSRRQAAKNFGLDLEDFERRHQLVVPAFEIGQVSLDEYLERTIFHDPRSFSKDQFSAFMFVQSKPQAETIAVVASLARSARYLLATLNNESLEMNEYRIEKFGLRDYFTLFLSSCFLGLRKPDPAIYRRALQITQRSPEECMMIDDRPANLESAQRLGMRTIHFQNPAQLRQELRREGVLLDGA